MLEQCFRKNKKLAVLPNTAVFFSGLLLSGLLHSGEIRSAEVDNSQLDITCQDAQENITLQMSIQSNNKHLLKLTSATHSQFQTHINKDASVNLKLSKEQFPIEITSSYLDKTDSFIIAKNCQITS